HGAGLAGPRRFGPLYRWAIRRRLGLARTSGGFPSGCHRAPPAPPRGPRRNAQSRKTGPSRPGTYPGPVRAKTHLACPSAQNTPQRTAATPAVGVRRRWGHVAVERDARIGRGTRRGDRRGWSPGLIGKDDGPQPARGDWVDADRSGGVAPLGIRRRIRSRTRG